MRTLLVPCILATLVAGCFSGPTGDPAVSTDYKGTTLRFAMTSGPSHVEPGVLAQWGFALTNTGLSPVELMRGCGHEWNGPRILDAQDQEIVHQPPMANCLGYGHDTLAPNESWTTGATWNGHTYGPDGADEGPAPAGEYRLVIGARVDETGEHALTLRIPITLGDNHQTPP